MYKKSAVQKIWGGYISIWFIMATDGSVYEVGIRRKARVYKNRGESANKFSKQITLFMLGRNNKILLL